YANHVLVTERLERREDIMGPSPAEFGELGHLILKLTYQELIDRGYFVREGSAVDIESTLTTIAERAFAEHASNNPVGYPLAWEILQEGLAQLLRQVIGLDLPEISNSGYLPVAVEIDAKDKLA